MAVMMISRLMKLTCGVCLILLGYLIVGKDPSRQRIADAETREVPCLTLNMLNSVLNRSHSFADIESLPAVAIESLEGTAYRPGGGVLPPIPAATSAAATSAATTETAKKKPAATKVEPKKPAAKKPAKAKKAKVVRPPTDRESVVAAALAAAAAGRNAHRAIEAAPPASSAVAAAASMPTSNAMVPAAPRNTLATGGAKAKFVIPRPGVNGAIAGLLNGKKFVLTGVFPEVGGGSGLSLGKDRMTQMIESFGGKVTGSVSGKTGEFCLTNITLILISLLILRSFVLKITSLLAASLAHPKWARQINVGCHCLTFCLLSVFFTVELNSTNSRMNHPLALRVLAKVMVAMACYVVSLSI